MKKLNIKKISLLFFILIIIFIITISSYYLLRPQSIPVLAYHDIKPNNEITKKEFKEANGAIISVEKFEKQMKYIKEKGYQTLSMDEFYCWMKKECQLPKKSVLITFDDGNKSIYEYVLPILEKYNLKGTSFVITSRILPKENVKDNYNFLTKEMIEEILTRYPNLELHSHTHDMHKKINNIPIVKNLSKKELNEDTMEVGKYLETEFIAYPFGSYTEDFIKVLKKNEYKMGFLYEQPFIRATQKNNLYKIPRITIGRNLEDWRFKLILSLGFFTKKNIIPR
jgi:peptidoglycan/xylan/chitin deacetylase (PgdA/CDA1 family)